MAGCSQHTRKLMENNPRFDLNDSIARWREHFLNTEALRREDVAELESHLRDAIDDLAGKGLSEEEAFLIAKRRLGRIEQLEAEFGKVSAGAVWLSRSIWMVIGILLFSAGANLGSIVSFLVLMAGHGLAVNGLALGFYSLGASSLILAALVWCVWRFIRAKGERVTTWISSVLDHPGVIAIVLTLLVAGLHTAAIFMQAAAFRSLNPLILAQFFAIYQWGAAVTAIALPLLLILILTKLAAMRRAWLRTATLAAVFVAAMTLAAGTGCGSKPGPQPHAMTPETGETALERAIRLVASGEHDDGVEAFLKLDWSGPLFSPGTILSYSEQGYVKLPQDVRTKTSAQMMADLGSLRTLVNRVREAGQQARARGDEDNV
jgi:hypothetical protein